MSMIFRNKEETGMSKTKRGLSLLLVLGLLLSPLAGGFRAYATEEKHEEKKKQEIVLPEPKIAKTVQEMAEENTRELEAKKALEEAQVRERAQAQRQAQGLEIGSERVTTPVRGPLRDFAALKQQLETAPDGEVTIDAGEYRFTDTIRIKKKLDLKIANNGTATFYRDLSFQGTMIEIAEDAGLTLNNGIVMDGEGHERSATVGFIDNRGALVINGGVFQNEKKVGSHATTIYASGKNASVVMNGGTITNNDHSGGMAYYAVGAIRLIDGATMEMNGGEISRNQGSNTETTISGHTVVWFNGSPGVGGILVEPGSKFTMNGGTIKENKGFAGGVLVGYPDPTVYNLHATNVDELKKLEMATAVFHGGTITENQAVGGGAIAGLGNVDIELPKDTKLEVTKNRAFSGGGILIWDMAVNGVNGASERKQITKLPIETWSQYYAGKFTMEGGLIQKNIAYSCGGGIDVVTNGAKILGGQVLDNIAGDQGGGIYVATIPYTLHMENAYVANNHADLPFPDLQSDGVPLFPKRGGGVWFCPTGSAVFNAENGALIMDDNKAEVEAAGFFSSKKVAGGNYSITLSERSIAGGKIDYYTDGEKVRAGQEEEKPIEVKNFKDDLAVKSVLRPGFDKEIVRKLSTLIITGNRASKGGGLGSNGNIIFGRERKISLTVKKAWGKGTTPKEIEAEVRARLGEDDWLVEKIALNEANQFQYTLKGLPATVGGKPFETLLYVKELNAGDYKVQVLPIRVKSADEMTDEEKTDSKSKAFILQMKNTTEPPTEPKKVTTMVTVRKVWSDEEDRDGKRPTSIAVRLYADGKATDRTLVLSAENDWQGVFMNLDKYDADREIQYTVQEEGNLEDYEVRITGAMAYGFTITNTRKPEKPPEKPPTPEHPPIPGKPPVPSIPRIPRAGIGA